MAYEPLTPAQVEVLHLFARGLKGKAIARELNKTLRTVEMQMLTARERLNAKTTPHAVAIGMALGLITMTADEAKTIATAAKDF